MRDEVHVTDVAALNTAGGVPDVVIVTVCGTPSTVIVVFVLVARSTDIAT